MVVLGFDTATPATAVGARANGDPVFTAADRLAPGERPRHASTLLPLIERAAEAAGGWSAVRRIGVGIGPGTFTGIRIGVVTAKALASARGLELAGVETTSAIATRAARTLGVAVCAVIDGKRGEVFAAAVDAEGEGLWGPLVQSPQGLADRLREAEFAGVIAGDGAELYGEVLAAAGAELAPPELHRIDPQEVCRLAAGAEPAAPPELLPLYLRRPDAERWSAREK